MSTLRRRDLLAALPVMILAGRVGGAAAARGAPDRYPDHVVRLINPFPPGGSVDVLGRILAEQLSESFGQQVIIETHSGADGNVGAEMVAKANPDGYTLLFTAPGPLVVNQALYARLAYDPAKDFVPIALFAVAPMVLVVNPALPVRGVAELIGYAKSHPGAINYGSAGIGSTPHLCGELFKSMADVDIVHVPYRGTGPAMSDLIGGHIQMFFDLLPTSLPQIEGGRVRALGNAGLTRPSALAGLPTLDEQGLKGFDAASWVGLVAPAHTPAVVVAKLIAEVEKVARAPDVAARVRALGSEPGTVFGADFAAFMKAKAALWAGVIKAAGVRAN